MPKRDTTSKSVGVTFSEAEIKRYQSDSSITQLKDPRYPLRLRFTANRQKASWHLVTYREGGTNWRKVGDWPLLTFSALVKRLPDLLAQVAVDPKAQILSAHQFNTVGDILTWYQNRCEQLANLSDSRKSNIKSVVKCHLLPALGSIPYHLLNPAQVDDFLICPLQAKRKVSTVRLAFVVLKAAFNQARKQKRIESNPMAEMVFSDFIQDTVKAREGALKPMMIPDVLARLKTRSIKIQMLVTLLLCYATRIGETRLSRWDQFDFDKRTWTIPKDNTKTRQTHELPLSSQFIQLLNAYRKEQRIQGYQGIFLFPGAKAKKAISESTASKLVNQFSQGKFTAHDFRKLARSVWADLKIDYMVGERLLNHKLSKLDEAYFQSLISQPKRDAVNAYHQYLDSKGFDCFHAETTPRSFLISKQGNPSELAA